MTRLPKMARQGYPRDAAYPTRLMTSLPRPTEIDQAVAYDWLRYSLDLGWVRVISPGMRRAIDQRPGRAYALVPSDADPERLLRPKEGGITRAGPARMALTTVLTAFARRGACSVVVEDAMRRKSDPRPNLGGLLKTSFWGEQVLHWAALQDGSQDAVGAIDRGSLGYPTNAAVTSASPAELGLVDGADLDSTIPSVILKSLMAVIVAAYDAETYIIWEPD